MEIITDKYTAFNLLKRSTTGQVVKNFAPELRDEFDIMMEAVTIHGYALQYASERLSNNKDIVEQAVSKHQLAFKHAGAKIMNNSTFVLDNLEPNITSGEIYKYCSAELQKDRDFAISFIQKNAFGLKYFPAEFKADKEIAILALNQNEYAFQYIKKELRDTPELTKRALVDPQNFRFIAKRYKNDENIALLAIEHLDNSLDFSEFANIGPSLKNNKDFFRKVISKRAILFQHASDDLKKDCAFMKEFFDYMQIKIDYPYSDHKELLTPHLLKNSYYFRFASEDMLNDRHIILKALQKTPGNIRYASDEIKNMLGTNKAQYVSTLEKIISIEALAEKLNTNLDKDDKTSTAKIKI